MGHWCRRMLLPVLLACGACQTAPRAEPPARQAPSAPAVQGPSPTIDKLELQALPTVVNLDDKPGADGVQVKLYLWRIEEPLAVALERGTVEFLLYEGRVPRAKLHATEPARTWAYSAGQLRRFAGRSLVGSAYALALTWGDQPPRSSTVTLSARLLRPDATPLYADPLNLAMGSK